jgi:hypothetical protein
MEHSLHIACKHFVEAIAPASPAAVHKKVNSGGNGDGNNSEDDDTDVEFSSGDALGKALALMKQVSIHGNCIKN